MRILISGFTPFGTHTENSSQIMAEMFKHHQMDGFEISSIVLPVTFRNSFECLKEEIERFRPDVVLCLGLADKRRQIDLEKIAINLIHCDIADNEGVIHQNEPIAPGASPAYFSTLPLEQMKEVQTPFPVQISFSAGAYVCNYIMYQVLHHYQNSKVRGGFIHLPHLGNDRQAVFDSLVGMIRVL